MEFDKAEKKSGSWFDEESDDEKEEAPPEKGGQEMQIEDLAMKATGGDEAKASALVKLFKAMRDCE